jgi:hypothetical protein
MAYLLKTLINFRYCEVRELIKHIVMWKLKEFAEGKSKLENANIIKISLENLQEEINQIRFIEVGININKSVQAYDIILYSEFKNTEDLNIYQNHHSHMKVSEFIGKVRDERLVVDYEV